MSLGLYLLVTSTVSPIESLSVFDAKRVLQLIVFAFVLVSAAIYRPLRTETLGQLARVSPLQGLILALFFSIGIFSSLQLDHPVYALIDVSMIFLMMILIFVIAGTRELSGRLFDKFIVLLLAVMGLAVALQELMGFVASWAMGTEFSYSESLINFAHPRFYNQLQTWSIPLLAALPLIFPNKRWVKFGCVFLLGLQWFLVMSYAARGTAVSLLIAMTFVAIWLPKLRQFWLKYQLAGFASGVAIYFGILLLNGLIITQSQTGDFYSQSLGRPMTHMTGRSMLWQLSVEDALRHPFLGAGPAQYACGSEMLLPAHPHSVLFQLAGEWGLIALILFLSLAITIGLKFLRRLRNHDPGCQSEPPLTSMLTIGLIAGAIHSCVSGLLIMPASQVALILIAGWTLNMMGSPPRPQEPRRSLVTTLFAGMLTACTLLIFVIIEVPGLSDRTGHFVNGDLLGPRFWQDGRVCDYNYAPHAEHT